MTLATELSNVVQQLSEMLPEEKVKIFKAHLERLSALKIEQTSLKIGDKAPDFTLPNAIGKVVNLGTLLKGGPVVVTFYRGTWCPFCNLQLRALQSHLSEIKDEGGAQLIAISPQTPDNSLDMTEKNALTFEVLSDLGNAVAKQFGIVFQVEPEFRDLQKTLEVDLANYNGDHEYELPTPATYIINPDGIITYAFVESDWTQRAEPKEIVSALQKMMSKL